MREEGRKGTREEGRKGTREEGRKKTREEGRKGTREEGRKGGKAVRGCHELPQLLTPPLPLHSLSLQSRPCAPSR